MDNKIRFIADCGEGNYYRDEVVPFIPSSEDQVYLPANKQGQWGLFTVIRRKWFAEQSFRRDIVSVILKRGDGIHIPGPYDLSSTPGWVEFKGDEEEIKELTKEFSPTAARV